VRKEIIMPCLKKEIIYCPKCRVTMEFDREETHPTNSDRTPGIDITWNIYKCPQCKFESLRRKY